MKGDDALADAAIALAGLGHLLKDVQVERDVEFSAARLQFLHVLAGFHLVHRRPEAGTEEFVFHLLANDLKIRAAEAKNVHAAGDFGISQQRCAGHGVIPVAVEAGEGKHRGEGIDVDPLHTDAAEECEGEPDERTDAMPEIVAHREGADKSFEAVVPVLGPLDRTMRWPLKLADHSADTETVHFADGHRAHVHLVKGDQTSLSQRESEKLRKKYQFVLSESNRKPLTCSIYAGHT